VTEWVLDVIDALGYFGIAVLMVLECIFPPIPSEVVLPVAGFAVDRGEFSFFSLLLVSTLGSLVGAWLLYAAGRIGGRPLVLRYMRALRLRPDDLDRAERWFVRRGDWIIASGRLVPGVRSVVSIPAGMLRMPLIRFTILTAIGSAVWNAALISLGWGLGASWESASGPIGTVSRILVVVLGVAIVVAAIWWMRRKKVPAEDVAPTPDETPTPEGAGD
jgi:membrane protein DedA with SNARE-associated domain